MEDRVRVLEGRLRTAIMAGDADALDRLLADDALYTDPTGAVMDKAADLAAHRSGALRVTRFDVEDQAIRLIGTDAAVVQLRVSVAGSFGDAPIAGTFSYMRTWSLIDGRVVAASCTPIAGA